MLAAGVTRLQCGAGSSPPTPEASLSAAATSTPSTRSWFLFGVVCLVFSTTWLAIRIGLEDLPPLGAAGLRYLVACPILFAVARARHMRWPRGARAWRMPLLLGVTMFTVPFALIYYAEQTVPSGLAAVLFASHAIFTALMAHVWLADERLSAVRMAGVVVGFLGVVVVFWDRVTGYRSWLGESALVLTALVQASSSILVRRTQAATPAVVLSCIGTGVGAVLLLGSSALFEGNLLERVTPRGALAVLYLAVFGSVIAFTVAIHLIHVMGANRVAMTVYVTPVLALLWGRLLLAEPLGPNLFLGTALVVGGVWLTNRVGGTA